MISFIVTIVIVVIILILGIFTFLSNPTDQKNKYFALSNGLLAFWIITFFLENEPSIVGYEVLPILLRLDFALAITYFFVWFAFCYSFTLKPLPSLEKYRIFPVLTLSTLLLVNLSIFTDIILTDITFNGSIHFTNGPLWWFYALHMTGTAIGSLFLLLIAKQNAKKTNQTNLIRQINLIVFGYSIATGIGLVINLILQPFFPTSIEVSRLGIYSVVVLVALTSYAITRYHFFDIKLAIVRTFSFFSLSLVILLFCINIFTFGILYLFNKELTLDFVSINAILTTVIALSFHPLQKKFASFTTRFFYKNYYDPEKLFAELTHSMASTINIDLMTSSLLRTINTTLHLAGGAFIIYRKDGTFDLKASVASPHDYCLDRQGAEKIDALYKQKPPCPKWIKICRIQDIKEESTKELFRALHIRLIIPITKDDKIITLFILGNKKSGQDFSPQDLEFLGIFADQFGIAIQNAQAYREITEFNAILEARVNERTKQLEEAQAEKLKEALALSKLKDEFVFIATHELRTPLTAILLLLELTSSEETHLPLSLKSNLDSIREASNHLNQLIEELLEIARTESTVTMLPVESVDLVNLVQQTEQVIHSLAEIQGISVSYVHADTAYTVLANKEKLKEVVTNLISNAIKYNKPNGKITITFTEDNDSITTEISDTGYGIAEEYHSKIFDKFFRVASKEVSEQTGTGLGLFISKMLLEKMGGSITFSSKENEGSTFAFTLRKSHTDITR